MAATGRFTHNGLPALSGDTDGALPRLRKWVIPGTGRHFVLRDGCVGFLLAHWALYFHEKIERLDLTGPWDEWGYHPGRPIAGTTILTNHAAGAAVDTNATRHPLGVRGTFTGPQRRRMRWALAIIYRGCLRSGEFYTNRVDGMHCETVRPFKALERNARRLSRTPRGRRVLRANPGARAVIFS